ncbi:unnamed protein product [Rotaria socialis]|uniref:G-protein coupled receptors family 1 profile domain-containing protein n=1 Tax=Rotaria socialis TaxID=392032 RepID=A0A821HXG9_9BILA|nr:unnamed protein product [Rotaria socialis]CAF3332719.1 unnamed protein product [Rotaria socialis]CAF3763642.1 unnamed protein product [Rotaria socialis]CAF4268615.1 unnamed protein product [Rotaria socialis]CAF4691438.1 unnamed protein product [Rotaria socialis]
MSIWIIMNIVLNLLTLINSIVTILIFIFALSLIIVYHRRSRSVLVLLTGHTCSTLLISASMLASMATASLCGCMNIVLEQHGNTCWCVLRGFCIHGFLCALYDSYIVQATYRLCRVVFYRRKNLYSFPVYSLKVPIETLFRVVNISPVFLLRGDVIYLSSEYYCQTSFTNASAIVCIAIRRFLLPLLFISVIYVFLLKYLQKSNSSSSSTASYNECRHLKQNRRDLLVIRRLLIMLDVLILLGLPSAIFLVMFMASGHFVIVTYRTGRLFVSFSFVLLAYMLIRLTDPLKKSLRRHLKRNSTETTRRKSPSTSRISLRCL